MTVTEESRHRLHQSLDDAIGPEQATTLMEHLPPVGWADVATKADLAHLQEAIEARFALIDGRFDGERAWAEHRFDVVDARFDRVDDRFDRVDARFDMVDARFDRIDERFDEMRQRHDDGIAEMRRRHDDGIAEMRQRHDDGIAEMRQRHDDGLGEMRQRHDDGLTETRLRHDDGLAEMRQRHEEVVRRLELIESRFDVITTRLTHQFWQFLTIIVAFGGILLGALRWT